MRNSEVRKWEIEISTKSTKSDYIDQLEKLTAALHSMLELGLHLGMVANQPDFQSVYTAAGNLNIALYVAQQIARGVDPATLAHPNQPTVM